MPDLLSGGPLGLYSPSSQPWLVGDMLRDVPDTPSLALLQALPEAQKDVLFEAARMFVSSVHASGGC
jgi:hypothetical protein